METIRELLARHEEAYRLRDAAVLARQYTKDAGVSSPMFPRADGRDMIESSFAKLFRVFPDWTMTFDERLRLDIEYIERRSTLLDLRLIAETALAVFKGSGA